MDLVKKVKKIAHHRNGISGAGFHIIQFTSPKLDGKRKNNNMLAIVFDEPRHVAVFDFDLLKEGNIKFGENSWRGDIFEKDLREVIKKESPI